MVHPWTMDPATHKPLVPFTTFSICMAYVMSGGRLDSWAGGLEALECLREVGRRVRAGRVVPMGCPGSRKERGGEGLRRGAGRVESMADG